MKLKDPPADMDVPQEIEIRLSNIDSEKMGNRGNGFFLYLVTRVLRRYCAARVLPKSPCK